MHCDRRTAITDLIVEDRGGARRGVAHRHVDEQTLASRRSRQKQERHPQQGETHEQAGEMAPALAQGRPFAHGRAQQT